MTILELKRYLLCNAEKACEAPAVSCSDFTLREMWEFYNDMANREIKRGNYFLIISEIIKEKIFSDFGEL